jgi:hypothetical protein
MCSLVRHSLVAGQPLRFRPLREALRRVGGAGERVWFARPGESADHIASLPPGAVPGSELLSRG